MSGPAFTLKEFFARNGLKKSSYYKMRQQGKGAREMRLGSKVMISPESEADWRRARETPDQRDIATIKRLHVRGRKAGRRSVTKRGRK